MMVFSNRRTSSRMLDDFLKCVSDIKKEKKKEIRHYLTTMLEIFRRDDTKADSRQTWSATLLSRSNRIFHVDDGLVGPLSQIGDCFEIPLHTVQIPVHIWQIPQHVIGHPACGGTVPSLHTHRTEKSIDQNCAHRPICLQSKLIIRVLTKPSFGLHDDNPRLSPLICYKDTRKRQNGFRLLALKKTLSGKLSSRWLTADEKEKRSRSPPAAARSDGAMLLWPLVFSENEELLNFCGIFIWTRSSVHCLIRGSYANIPLTV